MQKMLILLCALAISSCSGLRGDDRAPNQYPTSWSKIEDHPLSLEGSKIWVCGWFVAEFEGCQASEFRPTNPGEPGQLWVAPATGICELENVMKQPISGWADIVGEFHYSKEFPDMGFGQFGMYRAVIGNAVVTMRDGECQ